MSFDVFLSHHHHDAEVAHELAQRLTEESIRPFLDALELTPGRPWQSELEDALLHSKAIAVLVGPEGLGSWERMETQAFLSRAVREELAVIPISLPGGPPLEDLPVLLKNYTWVDLREGLTENGIQRLVWGITGERPPGQRFSKESKPGWNRRTAAEIELYSELATLRPDVFEELVFRLRFPWWTFSAYGDLSHGERLEQVLEYLRGDPDGIEATRRMLATLRTEGSLRGQIAQVFLGLFAWLAPKLYAWWIDRGLAKAGTERRAVEDYLSHFTQWMEEENEGDLVHVASVEVENAEAPEAGDYALDLPLSPFPVIRRIRNRLRQLAGLSGGGDRATAQLASAYRSSRALRDAVRVLRRSRDPIVLLGDPGSGKSMTLREVGREVAKRQQRRHQPALVLYVRLGSFRDDGSSDELGGVFELLRRSTVTGKQADQRQQHPQVWKALPWLIASGRLIVLFDGMDEMKRESYGARVAVLSRFAGAHKKRVKTLFACRINDFSPEFRHRQLVLLPFDRNRISEYLEKNLPFPLTVEGVEYRRSRQLLHALLERPALAELATNPLMLFLICRFLVDNGADRWPSQREELFTGYVKRVVMRARRTGKLASLAVQDDQHLLADLAWLAFEITMDGAGSVGRCAWLAERRGEAWLSSVMACGQACGFLFHETDLDQVRFTHHRLQEYFTARHLASNPSEVPWDDLLDQPRWQETLLNLVSLGAGQSALEALAASLKAASSQFDQANGKSWPVASEVEAPLADRMVLASQILREAGENNPVLPPDFAEVYGRSLALQAAHGRPPTQVKALWSWKSYPPPERSFVTTMNQALRSKVRWVRDQAVLLVGSESRHRSELGSDLVLELGFDLIHGQLIRRAGLYAGAIARRRLWRWFPALLFALACTLLFHGAVLAGCGWLVHQFVERYPSLLLEPNQLLLGLPLVCTLLIWFLVRGGFPFAGSATVSTAGVLLLIRALEQSIGAGPDGLWQVLLHAGLFFGPVALAYLTLFVVGIAAYYLLFILPHQRRGLFDLWPLLKVTLEFEVASYSVLVSLLWWIGHGIALTNRVYPVGMGWVFLAFQIVFSLAALFFIYAFATIPLEEWVRDRGGIQKVRREIISFIAFLVLALLGNLLLGPQGISSDSMILTLVFLYPMLGFGAWIRNTIKERSFQSEVLPILLFQLVGLIPVLLLEYFESEPGKKWFFVTLALTALFILLGLCFYQIRGVLRDVFLTFQRMQSATWKSWLLTLDSRSQAFLLRNTRRQNLLTGAPERFLTPQEFLTLLTEVESAIQSEPAASTYWQMRHELEETLRQDRS